MATTQLVTCDRDGCKAVKSEKNANWISAGLTEGGIVFGSQMSIQVQSEVQSVADYCSPACAIAATVELMGWKKPGRPKGSRNRKKTEPATA